MKIWARISAIVLAFCFCDGHGAPVEAGVSKDARLLFCQQVALEAVSELQPQADNPTPPARIAIIIDDLGYNRRLGQMAIDMPAALTLAILPHSPHGPRLAEFAIQRGKEVIVHLPMSSIAGRPLDQGGLTDGMDREAFLSTLRSNLEALPQASGANNHMGSLLTQQQEPMQWLMEELAIRGLYFVDSRTTALSLAGRMARKQRVAVLEREVFLDNNRDCAAIGKQFLRLARIARNEGQSLAIGHPYPETLAFLAALLPHLDASTLELLPVSRLLEDEAPLEDKEAI